MVNIPGWDEIKEEIQGFFYDPVGSVMGGNSGVPISSTMREINEQANALVLDPVGRLTSYESLPPEVKLIFDASDVNPYDEAGRFREASMRSAAESQNLGLKLADQARNEAMWANLFSRTGSGSGSSSVVDDSKLQMMQTAIDDTLARGMEQLNTQYQIMADELARQQTLASGEIKRARQQAMASISGLISDVTQRGSEAQASILESAARTGVGVAAATEQALARLGSTDAVISEGIRERLAGEGEAELGLARSEADIQSDLGARLTQISQDALGRQQGLVGAIAQGSSAELGNLAAYVTAQRAQEQSAAEFQLDEQARQQALELMLNPPTKTVGGSAAGDLNKYALELQVLKDMGIDPKNALMAVVGGYEDELIQSRSGFADPVALSDAQLLVQTGIAGGDYGQEYFADQARKALGENDIKTALTHAEIIGALGEGPR